jgi:predicted nuclease of restriction endonuclease-like (RecB) superfamily
MSDDPVLKPEGYQELLGDLKERISSARIRAVLSVNHELILLYWQIGRSIQERQETHGWGTQVIDRLSADLRRAFPDMKGFSPRNLRYMRTFAASYPDVNFLQQVAAKLPWGHTMRLLDTVVDPAARDWYARNAIEYGWSRAMLAHHIDSRLYVRQGHADTNFSRTLPAPQSELAQQILKDPYNFDFLSLDKEAHERDLEHGLLLHIREFLLELGVGFALLGSQYRMEIAGRDYYIDLLFYHARLHCYVVIDLKMVEFEPAFAGTMNFYLSAVDDLLRTPTEQPSIGIILCKGKNTVVAEYALRDMAKPIGISKFELASALPESFQGSLPTIEDLEAELRALPEPDGKQR